MKKTIYPFIFSTLLIISCSTSPSDDGKDHRLKVVATTGMLYDAALNIGGEKIKASSIMGPGVDPHLYKATQGDLRKFREADLIIYNGLYLEGKMAEILEKQGKNRDVVAAAEVINKERLLSSPIYDNAYDPHVWFDVNLWKEVVTEICRSMQKVDEANAEFYEKNLGMYHSELDTLHSYVKKKLTEIPEQQRILVTAHDAFGYFGRAYNIEVKGIQGVSTLSDFGLKDIAELIDLIIERNVKALFVETSVSQKGIEAVLEGCKQKGHNVKIGGYIYSDAMGEPGTIEGTYIGMVRHNALTISEALK